jgi:phosphohistidine phosphatase
VLRLVPALYQAGPDVMLAVLHHASAPVAMMIGHNPGIGEFAGRLLARPPVHPEFARYPTGATLVATFEADDWAAVGFGEGAALDFVTPRALEPA